MIGCPMKNRFPSCQTLSFLLLLFAWSTALRADWPEHRGNLQRTGYREQPLVSKYWVPFWRLDSLSPPKPAWPAPAKGSLWQKLDKIDARVTDDMADVPLVVQDSEGKSHVLITSSANDRLVSVDPTTGKIRWQYVTQAPIRYAPSVSAGVAYLGSDDGLVRAINISNGIQLWQTRIGPAMPSIIGNDRLISPHPIRTSVLFENGQVFATAGLFPSQGVYSVALQKTTGEVIWRRKIPQSPQGYLLSDSEKVFVPTGRTQPFAIKKTDGSFLFDLPSPGGSFCMLTPDAFFAGPGNSSTIQGKAKQPGAKMLSFLGKQFAAGNGKIWTTNGTNLVGHNMQAVLQGKESLAWSVDCKLDQSLIVSGQTDNLTLFVAGGSQIKLYDAQTGQSRGSLSLDDPTAEIKYLAVSRLPDTNQEVLIASTKSGNVFAWRGAESNRSTIWPQPVIPNEKLASTKRVPLKRVEDIRQTLKSPRGWALVLGDSNGQLVDALLQETELRIVSLATNQQDIQRLQNEFQKKGQYGHRVTIWHHDMTEPLPFSKGLFNVVLEAKPTGLLTADLLKFAAAESGFLWRAGQKAPIQAPRLNGAGVWRHQYANPENSAATADQIVGNATEFRLLWFGGVGPSRMPDRHLRGPAPLTAGGAAIMQGDGVLIGIDPANGTERWQLEMPDSAMRYVTPFDAGYACLTLDGNRLMVAADRELWQVNAYSGKIISATPVDDDETCWGYVAETEGYLYASVMKSSAPRTATDKKTRFTYVDSDYRSERPLVTSRELRKLKPDGSRQWAYSAEGVILNGTIALNNQQVVFVEARSKNCLEHATDRIPMTTLMENAYLIRLSPQSGEVAWEIPLSWEGASNVLYAQLRDDKIVLTTSKSQNNKAHYMIRVVSADDGSLIWEAEHEHVKNGLFHGEQVHHPVILHRPDGQGLLVAEPYLYDLNTGQRQVPMGAGTDWALNRPGHSCGTLSGAGNSLFFRASNPTVLNLATAEFTALAPTRAGCWINMIPAGGRLLIPEGSASCVCQYSLQTSMAFSPIRPESADPGIPSLPDLFPEVKATAAKPLYRWEFDPKATNKQSIQPAIGNVSLEATEPLKFSPNGLLFNGTQWLAHNLDDPKLPAMPETITLEARVRVDACPEWTGIVGAVQDNGSYERGCMLGIHNDKFFFSLASSQSQKLTYLMAPNVLEKGKPIHLIGAYDGRTMRLYVNGVEVAQSNEQQGGLLVDENSWLTVGAYKDDNEVYPFQGEIKEVTIYEGVLQPEPKKTTKASR